MLLLEIGRIHLPGAGMWNILEGSGLLMQENIRKLVYERIMFTYGDYEREQTLRSHVSNL